MKGLSLVNDAFPSAGATVCEVHARRTGQKVVITDPQKRIQHTFTASSIGVGVDFVRKVGIFLSFISLIFL